MYPVAMHSSSDLCLLPCQTQRQTNKQTNIGSVQSTLVSERSRALESFSLCLWLWVLFLLHDRRGWNSRNHWVMVAFLWICTPEGEHFYRLVQTGTFGGLLQANTRFFDLQLFVWGVTSQVFSLCLSASFSPFVYWVGVSVSISGSCQKQVKTICGGDADITDVSCERRSGSKKRWKRKRPSTPSVKDHGISFSWRKKCICHNIWWTTEFISNCVSNLNSQVKPTKHYLEHWNLPERLAWMLLKHHLYQNGSKFLIGRKQRTALKAFLDGRHVSTLPPATSRGSCVWRVEIGLKWTVISGWLMQLLPKCSHLLKVVSVDNFSEGAVWQTMRHFWL